MRKKLPTISSSLLLLAGLNSCAIWAPDYQQPQLDTPQSWSHLESQPLISTDNLPFSAWWLKFNNPELAQLITSGLKNNNSIQQAQGNLEAARGQLKAVELSWIPSISAYAGYSSNPGLGSPLGFYGLWPQYSLFNIFNTLARQKSAKLALAAQEQELAATKLLLIGQIANSYYTFIAQAAQLKLYKDYERDLNEVLDIQKAEYNGKISSEIEVKGLAQMLNQAHSQQRVIENNLAKSQNALRYLLNQNPGLISSKVEFNKSNSTYPTLATLPVTVLANRPDVALSELEYRLALQNKAGVSTQLLPAVQLDSFNGAGNVANPQPLGTAISMNDAYAVWSLNPAIFGQIQAYNGVEKAAYYAYIDTVKKALREVDDDLVSHNLANLRYTDTLKAYQDAEQKYALSKNLYSSGIVSYLAALKDHLGMDQMAIDLNQIKLIQMLALVNLYQDLGGGYNFTESTPTHNFQL